MDSNILSGLDIFVFIGSLILVMGLGLWAGRKESSASDYYLAGRKTRWWGVAGSIFGSNVSANHIIGMMGVGFSVGFVQSHYEITAVAGLLLLCYGFLPVYRKLKVYTLSEYLSRRYDVRCRVTYAAIMLVIIVVVQMVPGFYIGSRALNVLLQEGPGPIDQTYYNLGVILMAIVTGSYTIFGGLKAVIVTDVIQSVLMLFGAAVVAYLTFSQVEIGGWSGMREMDASSADLMHLYLPSDHPALPWSGVLTGLMVLHFFYWGTNQFIVQRALAAQSDSEARLGILTGGFFKLLIPFISVGTGIAAFYLFRERGITADSDAAFIALLKEVVVPVGFGLVGLVAAGLIGAILSSIDSMMNSAATVFTFDFYRRFMNPNASDEKLILVGRVTIAFLIVVAAALAIFWMDPNSEKPFFLVLSSHQSKLVVGLVVAFALGMFWSRANAYGAFAASIGGIVFSFLVPWVYNNFLGVIPAFSDFLGKELNFMHTALFATILTVMLHVVVSLITRHDIDKARFTWTDLGGHDPTGLKRLAMTIIGVLVLYGILGGLVAYGLVSSTVAAVIASVITFLIYMVGLKSFLVREGRGSSLCLQVIVKEDRFWAGVLASSAIWMMFYFF